MRPRIPAHPVAATGESDRDSKLWQIGSRGTKARPHPHALRSSMCVGSGAKEEMSPATAKQAAPRPASRVLIEYEAHTSSLKHPDRRPNDLYLPSSNLLTAIHVVCIPLITTATNPLTASPCHLGLGDLPCSSVIASCSMPTNHADESMIFNPAVKQYLSSSVALQ